MILMPKMGHIKKHLGLLFNRINEKHCMKSGLDSAEQPQLLSAVGLLQEPMLILDLTLHAEVHCNMLKWVWGQDYLPPAPTLLAYRVLMLLQGVNTKMAASHKHFGEFEKNFATANSTSLFCHLYYLFRITYQILSPLDCLKRKKYSIHLQACDILVIFAKVISRCTY